MAALFCCAICTKCRGYVNARMDCANAQASGAVRASHKAERPRRSERSERSRTAGGRQHERMFGEQVLGETARG